MEVLDSHRMNLAAETGQFAPRVGGGRSIVGRRSPPARRTSRSSSRRHVSLSTENSSKGGERIDSILVRPSPARTASRASKPHHPSLPPTYTLPDVTPFAQFCRMTPPASPRSRFSLPPAASNHQQTNDLKKNDDSAPRSAPVEITPPQPTALRAISSASSSPARPPRMPSKTSILSIDRPPWPESRQCEPVAPYLVPYKKSPKPPSPPFRSPPQPTSSAPSSDLTENARPAGASPTKSTFLSPKFRTASATASINQIHNTYPQTRQCQPIAPWRVPYKKEDSPSRSPNQRIPEETPKEQKKEEDGDVDDEDEDEDDEERAQRPPSPLMMTSPGIREIALPRLQTQNLSVYRGRRLGNVYNPCAEPKPEVPLQQPPKLEVQPPAQQPTNDQSQQQDQQQERSSFETRRPANILRGHGSGFEILCPGSLKTSSSSSSLRQEQQQTSSKGGKLSAPPVSLQKYGRGRSRSSEHQRGRRLRRRSRAEGGKVTGDERSDSEAERGAQ